MFLVGEWDDLITFFYWSNMMTIRSHLKLGHTEKLLLPTQIRKTNLSKLIQKCTYDYTIKLEILFSI
jgi:hypothetical protein